MPAKVRRASDSSTARAVARAGCVSWFAASRRSNRGARDMRKVIVAFALAMTLLVTARGGAARASHYALVDVPRLVKSGEIDKLKKANVTTTEELLNKAA